MTDATFVYSDVYNDFPDIIKVDLDKKYKENLHFETFFTKTKYHRIVSLNVKPNPTFPKYLEIYSFGFTKGNGLENDVYFSIAFNCGTKLFAKICTDFTKCRRQYDSYIEYEIDNWDTFLGNVFSDLSAFDMYIEAVERDILNSNLDD